MKKDYIPIDSIVMVLRNCSKPGHIEENSQHSVKETKIWQLELIS
jgi:hypothetical protein